MKLMKALILVAMLGAGSLTLATASAATEQVQATAHLKAVQDLMASMQSEKMMRSVAGSSRYESDADRNTAFAKLGKVPAAEIHQRLARALRRHVSMETALEMSKFYSSNYGQRVLQMTYNSGPSYGPQSPSASPSERKELARPAYVKAQKAFDAAEPAIRHEAFVLLQAILRG